VQLVGHLYIENNTCFKLCCVSGWKKNSSKTCGYFITPSEHSITVKPIHRTYWRISCDSRNKHTRFIHRIARLVFITETAFVCYAVRNEPLNTRTHHVIFLMYYICNVSNDILWYSRFWKIKYIYLKETKTLDTKQTQLLAIDETLWSQ